MFIPGRGLMFTLTIGTDSPEFAEGRGRVLAHLLRVLAEEIDNGAEGPGVVLAGDRAVGAWSFWTA